MSTITFSETDLTEDLKKFDIPTLVMHGDDDPTSDTPSMPVDCTGALQEFSQRISPGQRLLSRDRLRSVSRFTSTERISTMTTRGAGRVEPMERLSATGLTGDSTSVRGAWDPLSRVGATVRTMLVSAAAQTWKVDENLTPESRGVRISAAVRISHA